jgi:hypothetical protein
MKAEKIVVSETDYHGISIFPRNSTVYREILGLMRTCARKQITVTSTPDGTDPPGKVQDIKRLGERRS